MDIYICGGSDEKDSALAMIQGVISSNRIYDMTGKTSFSDWAGIVQHSDLVIGNDSATLHLAAASSRKAICIAGVYDKGHFFSILTRPPTFPV